METAEILEACAAAMTAHRYPPQSQDRDVVVPDEVAVAFRGEKSLLKFVDEAKMDYGVEHFNSVPYDTMRRQDILGQSFGVRFEFLRLPRRSWRIEAMAVMDGWAPLHDEAMNVRGAPCIIHVSYKLEDLQAYQDHVRWLMDATGMRRRAEYTNSYGMFSYWTSHDAVYLKPRVNLRDVQD